MQNFIQGFSEWSRIVESTEPDDLKSKVEQLRHLAEIGMIEDYELKDFIRKQRSSNAVELIPEVQDIKNSPEYAELQSHGLELVSSRAQLFHGTFLFGFPEYSPRDGYAIGLFPGNKYIRRMKPKGIKLGVWKRELGSMDFRIKELRDIPNDQFYRVAMRWILDHIDLEDPKFGMKRKTHKGYFNQFN
jgi:hypothetical protein